MKNIFAVKIKPSPTVVINSLALGKIQKGERLLRLNVGEPKIEIPYTVKQAIIKAVKAGKTLYPPVAGLPELRTQASEWINKNYHASYEVENTLVTNGGKLGIFLTLQALLKKDEEVIVAAPFWVSYPAQTKLFNGKLRVIQTKPEQGWKISAQDVIKIAGKKARILILNNANNPTGAVYTRKELKKILLAAKKKNLTVISDEVYSSLVYGRKKFVSAGSFRQFQDRVIVVQSCSKNFALPGLRVGFVFAPKEMIKVLTSLLGQSTSGADTLAQWAALAALKNSGKITSRIKKQMENRRKVFFQEFQRNFGVKLTLPDSSIYAFVPISAFGAKEKSSMKFCREVLQKTNVVMVPGTAFGREGYVRCSFGEKTEVIREALGQLADYLQK